MKNLSKREKILVIAMLSIAIFYAYYRLFLSPAISQILQSRANINSYNNQLNQLKLTSVNNKKLDTQLEQLQKKFQDYTKTLPQNPREPEVAYNLKVMADSSKVVIQNIGFNQPTSYVSSQQTNSQGNKTNIQNSVMCLPVTLLVSGDYNSILNFVSSIEGENRIAEVEDLNISQLNSVLQANININYFYVNSTNSNSTQYDFNKGTYGKDDLFK